MITPDTVSKLTEWLKAGCTVIQACMKAKIAKDVFYKTYRVDAVFKSIMDEAAAHPNIAARSTVQHNIVTKRNGRLALDYLKATDKDFQPVEKYKINGNISVTFQAPGKHPFIEE